MAWKIRQQSGPRALFRGDPVRARLSETGFIGQRTKDLVSELPTILQQ